MRTNIIKMILLCISLMLICQACGFRDVSQYQCDVENMESIEIVELGETEGEYRTFTYTTLVAISDNATFLDKFNKIPVRPARYINDPMVLSPGDVVIKINYLNGEYDLISYWVQVRGDCSRGYGYMYSIFDIEQFNALIAEYLEE